MPPGTDAADAALAATELGCDDCHDDSPGDARLCPACARKRRRRESNAAATARRRAALRAAAPPSEVTERKPSQRIAALLGALRSAQGRTLLTEDLRLAFGYGDEPAGRKMLQRDLSVLTSRGLARAVITDDTAGNRDGVRIVSDFKPPEFELTVDEHAAIARARARLGGPIAAVLPDGPDTAPARQLDLLLRLVRAVEEHHDDIPIDRLCELLGQDRAAVLAALRQADDLRGADALGADLFPGLTIVYDDDAPDDDEEDPDAAVQAVMLVRRPASPGRSPTRFAGLDELGRFAYTARECDDRLALIDQALWDATDRPGADRTDLPLLMSAHGKLFGWKDRLAAPEPPDC